MARTRAATSDRLAEEALEHVAGDGGNAVDAVIAGFLAAAAARPGALLGPLCAVVSGVGVGARAADGRCCQPGRDAPRPRGWLPDEAIPDTARAAAPRSLATLALLHAYGAGRPMSALARPAIAEAKRRDAPERAKLLDDVARRGPLALVSSRALRALVQAAGPTAGGLLGEADLRDARPGDEALSFVTLAGELELATPFASDAFSGAPDERRRAEVIVAADGQGKVAALAFSPDDDGVAIPELGVCLTRDAEPIRRGVPRVTPGTPRPLAGPIAVARRRSDGWFAALGVAGTARFDLEAAEALAGPEGLALQLDALRARSGGSSAFAATAQRRETVIHRAP